MSQGETVCPGWRGGLSQNQSSPAILDHIADDFVESHQRVWLEVVHVDGVVQLGRQHSLLVVLAVGENQPAVFQKAREGQDPEASAHLSRPGAAPEARRISTLSPEFLDVENLHDRRRDLAVLVVDALNAP